jgi:outer membrane protein assembly factor BamD
VSGRLTAVSVLLTGLAACVTLTSCAHQQANVPKTQEERLAEADALADRGKCGKAIPEYEKLLSEFPKPEVAEQAKFRLGKCRMDTGDCELAIAEFKDFVDTYPKSDLVDNAAYLAALCYLQEAPRLERDQTKTIEALSELNLLLRKYPNTDIKADVESAIKEARSRLAEKEYMNGQLYFNLGDYKSARVYFDYVVGDYGDTAWAPLALMRKARSFERQGMAAEAKTAYEQVVKDYPSSESGKEAARKVKDLGGVSEAQPGSDSGTDPGR